MVIAVGAIEAIGTCSTPLIPRSAAESSRTKGGRTLKNRLVALPTSDIATSLR
jgi:hypothetical protein